MRKSLLDLSDIDLDDFEAVERKWNGWVGELFMEGLRPSETPLPESTQTHLWYNLHPVGGLNDFTEQYADTLFVDTLGATA